MSLSFTTHTTGFVTFKMVDLNGRIVSENQYIPSVEGRNELILEIGSVPSGIYLAELVGEGFRYYVKVAR